MYDEQLTKEDTYGDNVWYHVQCTQILVTGDGRRTGPTGYHIGQLSARHQKHARSWCHVVAIPIEVVTNDANVKE
jgi:hypothetical protein